MSPTKHEKRRRKRLRRIAVVPSLVTLLNGVFGFASIHFAARGMNDPNTLWLQKPELTFFAASAWMLFFAMLMDGLDGFLARIARSTSSFGGQLDSLCDMVSFGVAPAFLMIRVVESALPQFFASPSPAFGPLGGKGLWVIAALYICCAAIRLARFNVEHDTPEAAHTSFRGLPSPAAAGVVAGLVLLYGDWGRELADEVPQAVYWGSIVIVWALPALTFALGLLMVSRLPYRHLVNQMLGGRKSLGHFIGVLLLVLFFIFQPQLALAIAFLGYMLVGPIAWVHRRHALGRGQHPLENSKPGPGRSV